MTRILFNLLFLVYFLPLLLFFLLLFLLFSFQILRFLFLQEFFGNLVGQIESRVELVLGVLYHFNLLAKHGSLDVANIKWRVALVIRCSQVEVQLLNKMTTKSFTFAVFGA